MNDTDQAAVRAEQDRADLEREFRTPERIRCSDGMCGAEDCARCFPGTCAPFTHIPCEPNRCPYCLFDDNEVVGGHGRYFVKCNCCEAQGPLGPSEERAISLWNN